MTFFMMVSSANGSSWSLHSGDSESTSSTAVAVVAAAVTAVGERSPM